MGSKISRKERVSECFSSSLLCKLFLKALKGGKILTILFYFTMIPRIKWNQNGGSIMLVRIK